MSDVGLPAISTYQQSERARLKNLNAITKIEDSHYELPSSLGMCSTCGNLSKRKTKLLFEEYWCDAWLDNKRYQPQLRPSKFDPIVECSNYSERGRMTLNEMYSIATLIDVNTKRAIGFASAENEVVITKPKEEDEQ